MTEFKVGDRVKLKDKAFRRYLPPRNRVATVVTVILEKGRPRCLQVWSSNGELNHWDAWLVTDSEKV